MLNFFLETGDFQHLFYVLGLAQANNDIHSGIGIHAGFVKIRMCRTIEITTDAD